MASPGASHEDRSVGYEAVIDGDASSQQVDADAAAVDATDSKQNVTIQEKETNQNNSSSNKGSDCDSLPPTRPDKSESHRMPFGGRAQHGISDLPESCRGTSDRVGRFKEEEQNVRKNATHSIIWLAAANGYSALLVFAMYLISLESLLSIALSVGLTVYTYYKTVRTF